MERPRDRSEQREAYSPAQPRRTRIGLGLGAVCLLLFFLAGRLPYLTETVFSESLYPLIVWPLAVFSSLFPFSMTEIVFLALGLLVLSAPFAGWWRVRRRGYGRLRASWGAIVRTLGLLGYAWGLFLMLWGFNYQRVHPVRLFHLPPIPEREIVREITDEIGWRLDLLRAGLNEDEHGVVAMKESLAELDARLMPLQAQALRHYALPGIEAGRAKVFRSSPYLLRIGVSGTYGPFNGEPNLVQPSAPGVLPFTLAHERAHLSGFAWEETASYVAMLTLWDSEDPLLRYSGWLQMWLTLRPTTRGRSPAVQRDLRAIGEFYRTHIGGEAPAFKAAYSTFLKAHGVRGGTRSYGRFANLVLRHLSRDGLPDPPPRVALPVPGRVDQDSGESSDADLGAASESRSGTSSRPDSGENSDADSGAASESRSGTSSRPDSGED